MNKMMKKLIPLMVALTIIFAIFNVTIAEESVTPLDAMPKMPTQALPEDEEFAEEDLALLDGEALSLEEDDTLLIEEEEVPLGVGLTSAPANMAGSIAQEQVFNGSVSIKVVGDSFQYGDTVTLEAELTGCENTDYSLQWEYSENGEDWLSAPGFACGDAYQYTLSDTTAGWSWRVALEAA